MVYKAQIPSSGGGGGVTSLNSLTGAVTISAGTNIVLTPVGNDIEISASGSVATGFTDISSGTNTTAAMVVGTGASLAVSGSGTIAATSSATVVIADAGGDTTTFPLLAGAATGTLGPLTDAGLTYNATTNALTTTTFIGALTGNADTATTATNATNTAITDDTTTNATMYPTWVTANTGNLPEKVSSTKFTFNPSTGIVTATGFVGTYNGNTFTTGTGVLTIAASKTLTASNTITFAGTDGSTLNIGTGGTLGTAAYTAASAYEVPLTFSTGLTRSTNTITVNTSQNIATLSNLTSNGIVTTSGGVGTLSVTATTGTGNVVLATSPTVSTPALTATLTAGASLANGNLCYMATADGKMELTDADAQATSAGLLAMCTATIAEDATGVFVLRGLYTTSGLSAGATYYISGTPGAITSTAPSGSADIVRVVGYALSSTLLWFSPSDTYLEVA